MSGRWTCLLFAVALAGCGGGDDRASEAAEFAGQMRRTTSAAPMQSVAPSASAVEQTLDWAEFKFSELFPSVTGQKYPGVVFDGVQYSARAYSGPWGTRYLGITPDGRIFGLGDFTGNALQQYQDVQYWSAQVQADLCSSRPANCRPPTASAGMAQEVKVGAVVQLDGAGSTQSRGVTLSYAWSLTSRPAGSAAVLNGPNTGTPTFAADVSGRYVVSLVVSDGTSSSPAAQVVISVVGTKLDTLQGSWDGIGNGRTFRTNSVKLGISVSGTVLTIQTESFFDGTCLYSASLTSSREQITAGTYQCSDFSTGTWRLTDIQRVDQRDVYLNIDKGGLTQRVYGMSAGGGVAAKPAATSVSSLIGTYEGISTGGPFGTDRAPSIQLSVAGNALLLTIKRFFSGTTCEYAGTVNADGRTVTPSTFRCSDFSSGAWTLNEIRSVGGSDLYVSLSAGGELRRTYGIR